MIQHLLLGDIAPLLVVLGLTGPLLRPLLAHALGAAAALLTHPLVALPLWIVDFYVWHVPVLYQAACTTRTSTRWSTCFFFFGGGRCGRR